MVGIKMPCRFGGAKGFPVSTLGGEAEQTLHDCAAAGLHSIARKRSAEAPAASCSRSELSSQRWTIIFMRGSNLVESDSCEFETNQVSVQF